jgi:hypothetical protein
VIDAVDISANLRVVQERIRAAAHRAGRDPAEVTLVGVTKTYPLEMMQAAYQAGLRQFGENRVEEGCVKIPAFDDWLAANSEAPARPTWHMIGHLQSRKVADALACFDVIHSVDSLRLAERLNRLAERDQVEPRMPVMLECNVSGEASKYGFELTRWADDPRMRADFFDVVRRIIELPRLRLEGLMTMAPIVADPEQARPVFVALRALRDALAEEFPGVQWRHLSMGMTDDFEVAIDEGATLVRIGRAIFGPRACEL